MQMNGPRFPLDADFASTEFEVNSFRQLIASIEYGAVDVEQ